MKKGSASRAFTSPSATPSARSLPKPMDVFWNTWSVEGFISEGLQPSELGWGTHETWKPKNAKKHKKRLQGGDLS
jgi:homospermidine synthase